MDTAMIIEIAGYVGSALVLISFLMASVVKLRIVNSVGSVVSAIYSLIIHAYPMALMNFCLLLINIYYLRKLLKKENNNYDMLSVTNQDSYLAYFLEHYKKDIETCFPGLKLELGKVNKAFMVCCDSAPVGVMLGQEQDGKLDILLDYSTPAYRDCSIGAYLLSRLPQQGIRKLVYAGPAQNHGVYLQKMGFTEKDGKYTKEL